MDARTASPQDADVVEEATMPDAEPEPEKISAYYSLVFPNFTYYLQTLTVTIGRRCIPNTTTTTSDSGQVDVDLGPLKSVSRLHAKIEYEEEEERFVLVVVGRNGAWVDGVWSGSGSKVPLCERSQIQIASRTFHFILPPPPPPVIEDSPSPSSQSSAHRARSRSASADAEDIVDITSFSPPSSLPSNSPPPDLAPPTARKALPLPEPTLPNTNRIKPKTVSKKRKKAEVDAPARPKPDIMPPKPPFTYAQLCYRAIKSLGGKATLQDICGWMMTTFDWYRYNEGAGWENSVRHNLSSGRAFKKMERCAGERGKGFFWSMDEKFVHTFEEQEAKLEGGGSATGSGKDGKPSRKKDKGASLLEPALKRSVKGDLKGGALPPPLTTAPLVMKTSMPLASTSTHQNTPASAISVKSEDVQHAQVPAATASGTPLTWPSSANASTSSVTGSGSAQSFSPTSLNAAQPTSSISALPSDVCVPIIVGPVPPSHPSLSGLPDADGASTTAQDPPPIVLHDNTLILNPSIFSHLTAEQLKELEALGAQKALEILQGYIKRFLKEKIKAQSLRGRGRGRPKRGRGAGPIGRKLTESDGTSGSGLGSTSVKTEPGSTSGPFVTTPLPPRNIQPPYNQDFDRRGQEQFVHEPANAIVPAFVDVRPPVPVPVVAELAPADITTTMTVDEREASPILVVDDSDDLPAAEGPATKRRRLDIPRSTPITAVGSVSG